MGGMLGLSTLPAGVPAPRAPSEVLFCTGSRGAQLMAGGSKQVGEKGHAGG